MRKKCDKPTFLCEKGLVLMWDRDDRNLFEFLYRHQCFGSVFSILLEGFRTVLWIRTDFVRIRIRIRFLVLMSIRIRIRIRLWI